MSFIKFESGTEKERLRQELRDAREELLKRAEKKAGIRAEREVTKKLRGDDSWMHPSVLSKIGKSDTSKSKKSNKKSKKEKKRKKSKKEKKSKKKKLKRSSSSDEDSSSEEEILKKKKRKRQISTEESSSELEESDEGDEWVEKSSQFASGKQAQAANDNKKQPIEREDWMTGGFMLKTYSKGTVEKKEQRQTSESYDPSKSTRELNPYWKDGGGGLPTFQRPNDDDENDNRKNLAYSSMRTNNNASKGNWRKKTITKDTDERHDEHRERDPLKNNPFKYRPRSGSPRREVTPPHRREIMHSPRHRRSRSPARRHSRSPTSTIKTNKFVKKPEKMHEPSDSDSEAENDSTAQSDSQLDQMNFLTDQQMNELGAKIIKAEIMGNVELAKSLNEKLSKARELRNSIKSSARQVQVKPSTSKKLEKDDEQHILLSVTDSKGITRPLLSRDATASEPYGRSKKDRKSKVETHADGQRVRYFPDDDRYDIKQMFEREKYTSGQDSDAQFAEIAGKHKNPKDDLEDVFADKVRQGMSDYDKDEKEKQRAIQEHEQFTKMLDNCHRCFDSAKMEKQLIVCMGTTVYLSLPWHEGLQPGHCLISPIQHVACSTQLDEDTWTEINDFRKALTNMFRARSQDVIFFETARYLSRRPHMDIHCVPSKDFEMAPFYFKKAIQESEQMWSTNKQLISLKDTNLRRAIPKGLPYFWVNFGVDSGFAHVIEDQERFPSNFAQEVIGGLLNLDTKSWRKPRREYNPIPKVKQFADSWKNFDCTKN